MSCLRFSESNRKRGPPVPGSWRKIGSTTRLNLAQRWRHRSMVLVGCVEERVGWPFSVRNGKIKTLVLLSFKFFSKMVITLRDWRWNIKKQQEMNPLTWICTYTWNMFVLLFWVVEASKRKPFPSIQNRVKLGFQVCIYIYIYIICINSTRPPPKKKKTHTHSLVHFLMVFAVFGAYFGVFDLGLYTHTYYHTSMNTDKNRLQEHFMPSAVSTAWHLRGMLRFVQGGPLAL